MKSILFSYIITLTLTLTSSIVYGAGASSFSNVTPGKSIKDLANHNPLFTHRYSADPGVMVYNNRVYVYATNDGDVATKFTDDNTYSHINSLNVMSSEDLVNWTDHGSILVAGNNGAAKWAGNSWAPCATYKKINGKDKFFLYFANNANGIGVLTSDSPTGPFKDPIGKALITRQTPNCGDVAWLFDPAVLVDTDGTGYLYFGGGVPDGKDAAPKTIRVVKLGADMVSLAGTPQLIDTPYVFEDSGINKIGNTYYYSYCTNWSAGEPYGQARIVYMTSSNPMGPFTYQGVCLNNPGEDFQTYGNNHHTIIEFKNKYYIFYHTEWLNKQVFGTQKGYRTSFVNEITFSNGKFEKAKGTYEGVSQLSDVDGSKVNNASSFAWQYGITIKGQDNALPVNYVKGAWTGISNVDLGNAKSITLKAYAPNGATIKVCVGSENGTVLGYVDIPKGNSLQNVTGNLDNASGTKNLFLVSSGDATIESWQLTGGNSSSTPSPSNGSSDCWSQSLGYGCCSGCIDVIMTDNDGEWGVENDDWCGIPKTCNSNNASSSCSGAQGYPCCKSTCSSYFQDNDGEWGVENDDWCLINKSIC
ncbi:Arabinanase/levansucrase/invertase [Neocallimastix lanati (nom. inval.)]|jgi:arabinoxylan arabinofuranohydrolase|nr:Arabinanase/levansucrase/invertase [Neocallimastix sp. JGI-2020a]